MCVFHSEVVAQFIVCLFISFVMPCIYYVCFPHISVEPYMCGCVCACVHVYMCSVNVSLICRPCVLFVCVCVFKTFNRKPRSRLVCRFVRALDTHFAIHRIEHGNKCHCFNVKWQHLMQSTHFGIIFESNSEDLFGIFTESISFSLVLVLSFSLSIYFVVSACSDYYIRRYCQN